MSDYKGERVSFHLRMDKKVYEKLKKMKAKENKEGRIFDISDKVNEALRYYLYVTDGIRNLRKEAGEK